MKKTWLNLSDEHLLQLYLLEGETACVGILLERYTLRLLGVALKYLKQEDDAKDMVQQVYEKVLSELGKYPIENFGGWLYRITTNMCLSALRQKSYFVETEIPDLVAEDDISVDAYWAKDQRHANLALAIAALKPSQQACITGFFIQKLSYVQLSESLGLDIKEVKSNIQNGKRNLRILLEQMEQEATKR